MTIGATGAIARWICLAPRMIEDFLHWYFKRPGQNVCFKIIYPCAWSNRVWKLLDKVARVAPPWKSARADAFCLIWHLVLCSFLYLSLALMRFFSPCRVKRWAGSAVWTLGKNQFLEVLALCQQELNLYLPAAPIKVLLCLPTCWLWWCGQTLPPASGQSPPDWRQAWGVVTPGGEPFCLAFPVVSTAQIWLVLAF